MIDRTDFELAFQDLPAVEGQWGEVWSVRVQPVGTIELRTGRIVVGDPFTGGLSDGPLARTAPAGRFPVDVSIVRRPAEVSHDERIAAARITFSAEPVVAWEPAHFEGQTPEPDSMPGYGVDAGTGCFACAERAGALDTEPDGERLLAHFEATGVCTWSACGHPSAPEDVVAFSSGWGDGFYGSWWGLDAAGEPVVLITDFDVLTQPCEEAVVVVLPRSGPITDALTARLGGSLTVKRSWFGVSKLVYAGPTPPRIRLLGERPQALEGSWAFGKTAYTLGRGAEGARLELTYTTGVRASRALPDT